MVLRGQAYSLTDHQVQLAWRIAAISVSESSKWDHIGELFRILEELVKQPCQYPQEELAITFLTIVRKFHSSLEDARMTFHFGDSMSYGIFARSQCFSVWGAASYGFRQLTQFLLDHGVKILHPSDEPLWIADACRKGSSIVEQLLLPRLIDEPPESVAFVLMKDPSDMMLNVIRNLGYHRWSEVFQHIKVSAIQELFQRPTFCSMGFLTGLYSLGFDYNVALEPVVMANLLITGSQGAFSVLSGIWYHRWSEVWAVMVAQRVIEVIQKGDFRRAQLIHELGYPKWDLVHHAFPAVSICEAIERLDQQRPRIGREDYEEVLRALRVTKYPHWEELFKLLPPARVARWIKEKTNPRLLMACLKEISYPFQPVCNLFTIDEVWRFVCQMDWHILECLQTMSYTGWSEVLQSMSMDGLGVLVTQASYDACQTVCLLGKVGVLDWNALAPSLIAQLFTMSLSTKGSEMILSLRKVGYTRWSEVFQLVDPFQVAYLLIEVDDQKARGSHSLGYFPETAFGMRCKFLLTSGYQGFSLLEDHVQERITKMATKAWM